MNLSGRGPSILLRKTVLSLKSPTGAFIVPLRSTNANLSGRGPSILLRKTVRSLKSPTGAFNAPLRCETRTCRSGRLHLAYARPFGRLKAPLGLSLLHFAAQTRTTLFLLCTKSCIVWRKIGVWCSFYWKFIKRKSQKLLVHQEVSGFVILKLEIYCSIGFIVGTGQGRLTNGFIFLYKPIHAASFFLLPYVTLRNSPQLTGNLV